MNIKLDRYLNATVMVSIPALFADAKCRPFRLLGVELPGLWLQSDELTTRLLSEQHQSYATAGPAVFVPFAHIAGVLVPTRAQTTTPTPTGAKTVPPKSGSRNDTPPAPHAS